MDRAARCGALSALSTSESDRMSGYRHACPSRSGVAGRSCAQQAGNMAWRKSVRGGFRECVWNSQG